MENLKKGLAGSATTESLKNVEVEFSDVILTYIYRNKFTQALSGVTFHVNAREFVSLVGPSGCGKTTILKLVAGLLLPSSGRIFVKGQQVRGPLKIIGMAFQNPVLLPWRTALANILLPLEVVDPYRARFRRDRKMYIQSARQLLELVHLHDFADRYPWQLSGGMQQRVSLCRALIHNPDILLLDEPFGALDAFTREELWLVLQELWLKRPCTVILVTHDLREALFLSDRVLVMSKRPGRVISDIAVTWVRPRGLEDLFRPGFGEMLRLIRGQIELTSEELP